MELQLQLSNSALEATIHCALRTKKVTNCIEYLSLLNGSKDIFSITPNTSEIVLK